MIGPIGRRRRRRQPGGLVSALPPFVAVLHDRAGRPDPDWTGKATTPRPAPATRAGVCALTGAHGDVVDLQHGVSGTFTTWDRLPYRREAGAGLSIPACWALRLRVGMQQPHAIVDSVFRLVDPPDLYRALTVLPDDPEGFVSVPQSRQKHLIPYALPGTIRVDDHALAWTEEDTVRLAAYAWLRKDGHGETALTEPVPRAHLIAGSADPGEAWRQWGLLAPWRATPDYLDVAARATRTPKRGADAES